MARISWFTWPLRLCVFLAVPLLASRAARPPCLMSFDVQSCDSMWISLLLTLPILNKNLKTQTKIHRWEPDYKGFPKTFERTLFGATIHEPPKQMLRKETRSDEVGSRVHAASGVDSGGVPWLNCPWFGSGVWQITYLTLTVFKKEEHPSAGRIQETRLWEPFNSAPEFSFYKMKSCFLSFLLSLWSHRSSLALSEEAIHLTLAGGITTGKPLQLRGFRLCRLGRAQVPHG